MRGEQERDKGRRGREGGGRRMRERRGRGGNKRGNECEVRKERGESGERGVMENEKQ